MPGGEQQAGDQPQIQATTLVTMKMFGVLNLWRGRPSVQESHRSGFHFT